MNKSLERLQDRLVYSLPRYQRLEQRLQCHLELMRRLLRCQCLGPSGLAPGLPTSSLSALGPTPTRPSALRPTQMTTPAPSTQISGAVGATPLLPDDDRYFHCDMCRRLRPIAYQIAWNLCFVSAHTYTFM